MGKKVYTDQLNEMQSENVRMRIFPIARNMNIDAYIGDSFITQSYRKIINIIEM